MRHDRQRVMGSSASQVNALAARLATKTHPTPNSVAKSPIAPNAKANATLITTPKSFSPTKVIERPCSRKRAKGMAIETSSTMIQATHEMYCGCSV